MAIAPDLIVRHAGDEDLPWVDAGGGIGLKVLRVSVATGVWVVRNRFQPGVELPTHKHTGQVEGFTISGRWHYREYDFYSTAGSFIHEPAGSVHTLHVPEDNSEPTDVLFVIEGALVNYDAAGQVQSVVDGELTLAGYEALCEVQGVAKPVGIVRD
ncbi:MAG TPA: 2,4'-dihydroxyacetophenone dioxygenase family protein [Acidimicrobiales bacterium]|nr:2,4'-dihydroxyacetophenone dioxygenase family protein [Acidimicrobiales bacterium]